MIVCVYGQGIGQGNLTAFHRTESDFSLKHLNSQLDKDSYNKIHCIHINLTSFIASPLRNSYIERLIRRNL